MPSSNQRIYPNTQRSRRGSGIAEGVVGVVLIIFASIGALLLLVNSGIATYQKGRLGYAAMQTASYGASLPTTDTAAIKDFARDLLQKMGINADRITVQVTELQVKGKPAIKVEIANPVQLFNSRVDYLPRSITMSDAAVCVKTSSAGGFPGMTGMMQVPVNPGQHVWIPVIAEGQGINRSAQDPGLTKVGNLYIQYFPAVKIGTNGQYN